MAAPSLGKSLSFVLLFVCATSRNFTANGALIGQRTTNNFPNVSRQACYSYPYPQNQVPASPYYNRYPVRASPYYYRDPPRASPYYYRDPPRIYRTYPVQTVTYFQDPNRPWCPHPQTIAPCSCDGPRTFALLNCDRINDLYQFWRIFQGYFPSNTFGRLTVKNSMLSRLPRGSLRNLKFEYIQMERNSLQDVESGAFGSSSQSLKRLDVVRNQLRTFPFHDLRYFPRIEYLDLSGNYLSRIPDYALKYNPSLKSVSLANNIITSIGSCAFYGIPMLEKLDLSYNRLTSLVPYALATNTPSYKLNLDLSQNYLSYLGYGIFSNQVPAVLNISGNRLASLSEPVFGPMVKNMEERNHLNNPVIEAQGNSFQCTCSNVGWAVRLPENYKRRIRQFYCTDVRKYLESLTLGDIQCPR